MPQSDETLLPHLEWEFANRPISITTVNENEHERLPKGRKRILVSRDEDYNLNAILQFEDPDFIYKWHNSPSAAGSFVESFDVTGSDILEHIYTLGYSYINTAEKRMDNVGEEFSGSANLGFYGLRMKTGNNNEVVHLTEWYLNGPRRHVFSRVTNRKLSKVFSRERLESKDNKLESIRVPGEASGFSVDFLRIKIDEYRFVIGKVPKGIGPEWSSNIGIEYRTDWGRIPNDVERRKILELCSFVFGRHLLLIGRTMYDKDEQIVQSFACSPWGKFAKSLCSKSDCPPISIGLPRQGKAETVINQLLPMYNELCDSLHLKEALWNCWIAREMPAGANFPILCTGIESMINGWFHFKKSESKGLYIENGEFENLLKEDVERIQSKLKGVPNYDKILRKILASNQFGITERYQRFFDEINLPLNEKERTAIKSRHIFAHGEALFDTMDKREILQQEFTLEALFNKAFLKLLEYSGTFIDYSITGWPEAQLTKE